MNLPRPHPEPPLELRVVVLGEPVPAQMGTLIPGVGFANRDKKSARVRSYKDHVRLRAMLEIHKSGWRSTPDETFAVELRAYVGSLRVIDVDNICKSVLDALKGTVFPDDRQVVELHARKVLDRDRPRLELAVRRLDAQG